MTSLIDHAGSEAAMRIAALLLGHFLADFVFQTRRMVQNKRQWNGLLIHGGVVFVVHTAVFLPFVDTMAVIFLAGLTLTHIIVDRIKVAYETRHGPSASAFLIDQAIHVAVAWWVGRTLARAPTDHLMFDPALFVQVATVAAAVAFLWTGGSALVRLALRATGAAPDDGGAPAAGHIIGVLERLILFVFVLIGEWAAVGLVIAAKSLARFENLKERPFAEYYLIGTLTSVLVAVLVGLAVRALV